MRLHITGASGTGTTTLGRRLAEALDLAHFDTDFFFWKKTDPPYTEPRPIEERVRRLQASLRPEEHWVLSGSIGEWGGPIEPLFELVVFLSVPTQVRLDRLRRRDRRGRHASRFLPGSDRHWAHRKFLTWAADYGSGKALGRNRPLHEKWLRTLECPVLRLEGEMTTQAQVEACVAAVRRYALDRSGR